MPIFHFEALNVFGRTETGQTQAASTEEAMKRLRARGLFVTSLANEQAETGDNETYSEPLNSSNVASPAFLLAIVAGGLASFLFGVGILGWQMRFLAGAKRVTALKVRDARHGTILRIHDANRVVELPTHSEDNHGLGSWNVLYNPKLEAVCYPHECDAALAAGPFFATMGSLFMLLGSVGLRSHRRDNPTADWSDVALLLSGFAVLSAVSCWVVASFKAEWRWGFSAYVAALLLTGLAIAALAAVKRALRRLIGRGGPNSSRTITDLSRTSPKDSAL